MDELVDLKLAFRQAENVARKRSVKAWFMTNILVKNSVRVICFFAMLI
jgi:hypothetical protein